MTDTTSSLEELRRGVERIGDRPSPGELLGDCSGNRFCSTALWNGVYFTALRKMKNVGGRKALIVLTDGLDRISPHSLGEAIEAAQETDTRAYTIQNISPVGYFDFSHTAVATRKLRHLAAATGGRAFGPHGDPGDIFAEIENELPTMYVLGFRASVKDRDGKVHKLEVRSRRAGIDVRARKRYVEAPAA